MNSTSLHEWFGTPLGTFLLDREQAYLDQATPDIFGYHALQLGLPEVDLLRESRIAHRAKVAPSGAADVLSRFEELPIATQSVDLAVLPHVLEFSGSPHDILREIDRVMIPEGRIIIIGFNPWSLFGLRRSLGPVQDYPWNGRFVSLVRIKDWLQLLGFDVSAGRLACYVPPFKSEKWIRRMRFMEHAGGVWRVACICCRRSSACVACVSLRRHGRCARIRKRSSLLWPSAKQRTCAWSSESGHAG
jgi:SAM-dependent methyltransferase